MKYPKIKLELSFLNSEFRVLHYVQFHWNITNKTMSHQVQQMNHYTKKLSHWQMLTYKPVTTTITVIITFRKQKLCSTLKMVSFDLVFPCLFFLIYYRFLFFLIASSTIFWVLAMFCDCLLSSSSCSPNALDRSSIANLWAAWKKK